MRKLILFNLVTLDGFFEGPNKEIDWHNVDNEFNDFAIEQLDTTDTLIFGRVTYQLMAGYWSTPVAIENDPIVAGMMNSLSKIIFSKTLKTAEWNNTKLIMDNVGGEILKLKNQPGKEIFIFGSADLSATLTQLSLIDEFRLMINPVILGRGNPLFKGSEKG